MTKTKITRTILGACAFAGMVVPLMPGAALAQGAPTPAQLMRMIEAQQRQLDALKGELGKAQAEAQAAVAQAAKAEAASPGFLKSIEIGGTIEVEATGSSDFAKNDSSDITLAKVEAFLDTRPTDYLFTHVQFLYEDDGDDTITLDEAFVTLGDRDRFPVYLQAGKWAVPFGGFDTAMSTDPLTKNLGETKEAAVLVGATWEGVSVEAFLYNGDSQETGSGNHIDQGGIAVGYAGKFDGVELGFGGGYVNNIADSDALSDTLGANATALTSYVGGVEGHASVGYEGFALLGGYMRATDSFEAGELAFNGQGAQPVAWNVEASYTLPILGKDTTFAATMQGTDEALALDLPERRYGTAVTVNVLEKAAVTVEYLHDEDYGVSQGGTGNDGHTATLKLAAEF